MAITTAPQNTKRRSPRATTASTAPGGQAALLNSRALDCLSGDAAGALQLAEEALHLATRDGDRYRQAESLSVMARCLTSLERYTEAREQAARAVALFSRLEDPAREAEALYTEGLALHRLSSYPQAIEKLQRSAELCRRTDNPRQEAVALQSIGAAYLFLGEHEQALHYGLRSREMFRQEGDDDGVARASLNIGNVYYTLSRYAEALDHLLESYRHFTEVEDKTGLSRAMTNIGNVYNELGDYTRAIEYNSRALKLHRETNNSIGEANALTGLGILYMHMQQYNEALECHEQSLRIFRTVGNRLGEANALSNIGNVYLWQKQYDEALSYYRQSLPVQQQVGSRTGEFDVLYNIGLVHGYLEDGDTALDYYNQALVIARTRQDRSREAWVLLGIGRLLLYEPPARLPDKTAHDYLLAALALATEIRSKSTECETHEVLADLYERQGNDRQSLVHYKEFHRLKQDVFSEAANRRLQNLTVQHRIEKTEKERELFRVRNEQLEQEVEFKLKELASMALHLVEKNAFLDSLRPTLQELTRLTDGEPLALSRRVLQDIEGHIRSGHDWDVFHEQMQALSNDFVERLTRRYPMLTPTEIRVCSLLKIRLSTKDIANLLHITTRAVEKHRYQIRKKIGLSSDTNLSTFFAAM